MNRRTRAIAAAVLVASLAAGAGAGAGGCGKPNVASVAVRKKNAELRDKIASLKRAREADAATIRALESRATTVPTLPHDRVEQLFTTHGLMLGRLTGGGDTDPGKPGDEALKVYVVPTDQEGDEIKAAGSFVVELFDLSGGDGEIRLGRWEVSEAQAREQWINRLTIYGYVLTLSWQTVPRNADATVKVTFVDALTGRSFTAQKQVRIKPSTAPADPSTQPSTAPATPAPAASVVESSTPRWPTRTP